jgi:hypothetical protein
VGLVSYNGCRPHLCRRVVQLTPPGSAASIVIGMGMTGMTPGSLEGLQLVVSDLALRAPSSCAVAPISVRSRTRAGCSLPPPVTRMGTAGLSKAQRPPTSGMHTWMGP